MSVSVHRRSLVALCATMHATRQRARRFRGNESVSQARGTAPAVYHISPCKAYWV